MNITLILTTAKKAGELSFCSRFKIYVLIVSMVASVFKITIPISFFCSQDINANELEPEITGPFNT